MKIIKYLPDKVTIAICHRSIKLPITIKFDTQVQNLLRATARDKKKLQKFPINLSKL
jgi:hypothetical protein